MKVTHDDERFMRREAQEFQYMEQCRELVGFQEDEDWECPYRYNHERFFHDFATTPEEWAPDEHDTSSYFYHTQRCHLCQKLNTRAVMAKRIADDPDYVDKKFKEETAVIRALNGKILLALPRADREQMEVDVISFGDLRQTMENAIDVKTSANDVLDCISTLESDDTIA